jgi:hypothetical protein
MEVVIWLLCAYKPTMKMHTNQNLKCQKISKENFTCTSGNSMFAQKFWEKHIICCLCNKDQKMYFFQNLCANIEYLDVHAYIFFLKISKYVLKKWVHINPRAELHLHIISYNTTPSDQK